MRRYYALPRFLAYFVKLRRNTRINSSRLVSLQEKKVREIVRYAYQNVPFYHKLLKANGIKPTEINNISDLKKLPIITKKDVQENYKSMISRKVSIERCIKRRTSGSTGFPLTVLIDRDASYFKSAVALRQFFECGGRLRDRQVQLRGTGSTSLPSSWNKPIYEYLGFLRTEWITMSEITEALIQFLKDYNPDIMIGYSSFFQLLAERLKGEISPKIIFCISEILTDYSRSLITSAFGAHIIDSYGCTEVGEIAWECPEGHEGYHMNVDAVLVEFLKDGETVGAGEEGETVLTNLFSYAMPFIRYNLGDVGVPSSERCSCGRTLPLMRLLKGRHDDFIVLPSGKKLPPHGLMLTAKNITGISGYKIIQEKRDVIKVLLKMHAKYSEDSVAGFTSVLQKFLGEDIEVIVKIVNEIPRDRSGKLRRIISKIAKK